MKRFSIYHPLLFAVYPIVFLYVYNADQIRSPARTVIPLVITLSLTALFWFLMTRLLHDAYKSGLVVSMFLMLFFSYSHIQKMFWDFTVTLFGFTVGRNMLLFPVWLLLIIVGISMAVKQKGSPKQFTRILNVVSLALICFSLFLLIKNEFSRKKGTIGDEGAGEIILKSPQKYRDIYYFIFDRYADRHTLAEIHGFDNSPFYTELRKRGFYVADSSRANYPRTFCSLASSFNMTYLSALAQKHGVHSGDNRPFVKMIEEYRVCKLLKSIGYTYVHIGSWYEPTSSNRFADINLYRFFMNEFTMMLFRTTILYPVLCKIGMFGENMTYAQTTLNQFEKAMQIPLITKPTYTFIHFLVPHAPYTFDRNGNVLPDAVDDGHYSKEQYIDQLVFVNKKILEMVDTILARSESEPIIILQADEGSFPERATHDYMTFDWSRASRDELKQKTGILNAYLFPGVPDSLFYQSITPVNSFSVLFNVYFGTNLPLLPDSIFVTSSEKRPFDFIDVTEKVAPIDSLE